MKINKNDWKMMTWAYKLACSKNYRGGLNYCVLFRLKGRGETIHVDFIFHFIEFLRKWKTKKEFITLELTLIITGCFPFKMFGLMMILV